VSENPSIGEKQPEAIVDWVWMCITVKNILGKLKSKILLEDELKKN
jgi:hypothetical protein